MDKVPMTKQGYDALEKELRTLKSVERPAVIVAIAEARAHGDLSENAEYTAARERQSFIEGRIKELESVISAAQIIDPSSLTGNTIKFGATILLADEDSGDEVTYKIVGPYESNADKGMISTTAPIARALIGKGVGDSVEVITPAGKRSYEVLDVQYI
ncbi:transcription elongation factor GreA [Micavibrio aeruginosavorus]|uniref:transcription elongation factor GreA n=1 Tax=Micavibrio aeruginosavorus TaxID=349221 RepID=UPI003F4AD0D0